MGVIIDSREPTKFRQVLKAKGLEFKTQQLITGDVICYNDQEPEVRVVIERKRIDDLISSYYKPRMNEQFERLSDEKFAVLIITGNIEDALKKLPITIMSQIVEEIIASAVIQYNFRSVIWMMNGVNDANQSGFLTMVKCIQKVVDGQLDAIPQKKLKLSKDIRINAVRQMFGLDMKASKNLLKKYGTVRNILKLTDAELLNVQGIGPAKAKTIRYILDESINSGNFKKLDSEKKCDKCKNNLTLTKMPGGNVYVCLSCIGTL